MSGIGGGRPGNDLFCNCSEKESDYTRSWKIGPPRSLLPEILCLVLTGIGFTAMIVFLLRSL